MKKLLILIILTVFSFSNAIAVTLYDALNQTYQNNIQLNAERENIKASEEDINISKADYKPSLTISGSKSFENTISPILEPMVKKTKTFKSRFLSGSSNRIPCPLKRS